MTAMLAGVVAAVLALAPAAGRTAAAKPATAPPPALNIVHHRLKRHAVASYQTLEASIASAYERAKMPLYWIAFQSTRDPRDVLYLNAFDAPEGLARSTATYRALAPAHPDLGRLSARLASLVESQSSMLTTRREEPAYTRGDVDFATMRALMLATFRVRPGHEGQFTEALRDAGGGGVPWIVYEANAESTFVLLWPLRSRAEASRVAQIPRVLREMRRAYRRADVEIYSLSPSMSRLPLEYFARSRNAAPKPKAH